MDRLSLSLSMAYFILTMSYLVLSFGDDPNDMITPMHRIRHQGSKKSEEQSAEYSGEMTEAYGMPISVEYALHQDLLRGYKRRTRPVRHPSQTVPVSVVIFLYQVIKLDQIRNTIILAGSFELYWKDEFLQWNPADYDGATEIFLSSTEIWTPELSLYYSHHFNEEVVLKSNNDVRVNFTGHIRYYIPFTTESICPIDVQYFPFDKQECKLFFGSWAHSNESISFHLFNNGINLVDFYENQEWELDREESDAFEDSWLYDYLGESQYWELLIVKVVIQRQSFYYVFNLVVPSTIITIVAVIGFHSPSTSGRVRDAKFRLGIMTLMSMSVILLAVVQDMPKFTLQTARKTKDESRQRMSGVPLIGLFYFCLLTIIGLSTITTSMFVFLERSIRVHKKIPWYLSWLAFDCCYSNKGYELTPYEQRESNDAPTPRAELRKRLSIAQYDNLILYQYFHQILEDMTTSISTIENALQGIQHELVSLLPQDDFNNRWNRVIRRLELLSLTIYLLAIFGILSLFFYHDWYTK